MTELEPYLPGRGRRPPKLLYVGGTGRTGSTFVARLLGQVPGWLSAGEMAFLWRYGLVQLGRCSCGRPIVECELWSDVLARVHEAVGPVDAARMVQLRRRFWSVHLPLMVSPAVARRMLDRLEEYPSVVEAVYHAVSEVSGAKVVVDSSKEPHYSYILRERTDLDIYFLHLVRDPRAVGHSWSRTHRELGLDGDVDTEHRGAVKAACYYDVSNVAAEALWRSRADRYRIMRYEDFVDDPSKALGELAAFVDEPVDPTRVLDGRTLPASDQHVAWGNPNRFQAGDLEIGTRETWRNQLGHASSAVLSILCGPVSHRYGYPWRRRGRPAPTLRSGRLARSSIG